MHPGVSLPHYQAEGCMSTCAAAWETEGQFSWKLERHYYFAGRFR